MPRKEEEDRVRRDIDSILGGSAINTYREIHSATPRALLAWTKEYLDRAWVESSQWKRSEDLLFRRLQWLHRSTTPHEYIARAVDEFLTGVMYLQLPTDERIVQSITDKITNPDSDVDYEALLEIRKLWTEERILGLLREKRALLPPQW